MIRTNILLLVAALLSTASAFSTPFLGRSPVLATQNIKRTSSSSSCNRRTNLSMRVVDIDSEASFDKTISSAGDNLVVVDYSTTWCGPCRVIAPVFEEMSDTYPNVVFLKVIGDATPEGSKLMKREGVRSVPSFHYFVGGEKVDVVNGANAEAIESAIKKYSS